jgi:kynurenine/2-aminoadipate aminotransferase
MINQLLTQWGYEKFDQHIRSVQDFYRGRRDAMVAAATKHLTGMSLLFYCRDSNVLYAGLAEWAVPSGGMFMWIKVLGLPDVRLILDKTGASKGVIAVSGAQLTVDESAPCPYFRASFSTATPEQFDLVRSQ